MKRRAAFVIIFTATLNLFAAPQSSKESASTSQSPQTSSPATTSAATTPREILDKYCITCHNERLKTANLILTSDRVDVSHVANQAEIWEKVVRKAGSGAMPPAKMPRPPSATIQKFVAELEASLDQAAAANPNPGSPAPHRLNRVEYTNAVRDILSLEIDGRSMLPADDSGYGFDNIGSVLSLTPGLLEKYMLTAHKIARLAVGDPSQHPTTETRRLLITTRQNARMSEDLPFGSRGGMAFRYEFPLDGDYRIGVRLAKEFASGRIRGVGQEEEIQVRIDGRLVKSFTFGGKFAKSGRHVIGVYGVPGGIADAEQTRYELNGDEDLNTDFQATAGPHLVGVALVNRATAEAETPYASHMPVASIANFSDINAQMEIDSVQIDAIRTAPQAGNTPSRQKIFICRPNTPAEDASCAEKIISNLARFAYRRPVSEPDLQPLVRMYRSARKDGDFDAGIEAALERILIAPEFLFRVEHDPRQARPGTIYRISDIDLASRLSFFLWSSVPDDQLLKLAEQGKLKDPTIFAGQVKRMLADQRATSLITNFGGQWLRVRSTQAVTPDVNEFPEFDDNLRQAMQRETEMFLESQMREDRPVAELLTANYTFLNQELAEHYGIPGVYGTQFRRVTLSPDSPRRGLLGQGSILAVSSYPTRTSPVLRGKFILDLLGSPPPPPPPNVPQLEATHVEGKVLSVREQMELHRKNPVCASCHAAMDPLGFALENFDAVGKWRTTGPGGTPIDTAAALPDGTKFNGAAELRDLLVRRQQEFISSFVEKLLTYSLGRGAEYYDRPAIRAIMRDAASEDYRWSSIIQGIARSLPFQERKAIESN